MKRSSTSNGARRTAITHCAWLAALTHLSTSGVAFADRNALDSVPGSPRPVAVGLSPEAPPRPPAPGGRAPSFGARTNPDAWSFQLSGRFSAWSQIGIGRSPEHPPDDYSSPNLHAPPLIAGPSPLYAGAASQLNFQYGNQTVRAFVSYEAWLNSPEYQGYYRSEDGARFRNAYVRFTPEAAGSLRLAFQVGAFPVHYGAPGPWGWGTFGPVFAIHGYGGLGSLDYDLTPDSVLSLEYGVSAVGAVDEGFVRGTYTQWPENGLSSIVNHGHAGLSYKNKYFAKLHYAYTSGRNFRNYLDDDPDTPELERDPDGRIHVAALELRWVEDPYGQLGVTPVFYDFDHATSVHDGFWWGIGWTAGGREMTGKYLGRLSEGTGKIAGVSTEYNFSVSRILSHPEPFDGNGRDLRVSVAFFPHWTVSTDDPSYEGADGYLFGATAEHVLLSWLSTTYRVFGESADSTVVDVTGTPQKGRWSAFNATVGLALHSDWQSPDRFELAYSRYFYSDFADNNPEQPLDREVFTLGASLAF